MLWLTCSNEKVFEIFKNIDAGEMWRARYEDDTLVQSVDELWKEIEPLYNELHKYVRHELLKVYGDKMDKSDNLVPAHLFGNMW